MFRRKDMAQLIASFPEQIKEANDMGNAIRVTSPINRVIVAGMGGSGQAGYVLKDLLKNQKLPIEVVQDYNLPPYVNERSLVFICSYSGDTQETIDMFSDAHKKKAKIIILTSGGKIEQQAFGKTFIKLPGRLLPRTTLAYFLFPMINVLKNSGLIKAQTPDLFTITKSLENTTWSDLGKDIAKKLEDKLPVVYSSNKYKAVGKRWVQQLNENAKVLAISNTISEQNHNEIEGLQKGRSDIHIIMIQDDQDHKEIRKRMVILKKLLDEKGISATTIKVKGASQLSKTLSAIHLGDWVSLHLAKIYGHEPMVTKNIDHIKEELK